jgi:4-hydroxybenzoate polyprenyltransferase
LKLLSALINSNIYISLAAVAFTIQTQIQLGMDPQWHPYLFLIFFATMCEYNLHRFVTVLTKKQALDSNKHKWVKDNLLAFYTLVILSAVGFIIAAFMAKKEVLMGLAPIALLTLFYSVPIYSNKKSIFRLRGIPYAKIFLIALTWSASTILLPVLQADRKFTTEHVILLLIERFIFVFAITIPFDIRDMDDDRAAGTKTLPLLFGEKNSLRIATSALLLFMGISSIHFLYLGEYEIVMALILSSFSTFIFLRWEKAKNWRYYHYAILDGTMVLQGLLVLAFSYLY